MARKADPGGIFASDLHRRVVSHLSAPHEDEAYAPEALLVRMSDAAAPRPESAEDLEAVLAELEESGDAERLEHEGAELWRATEAGWDRLTGGIADEPEPLVDGAQATPARLDKATKLTGKWKGRAGIQSTELTAGE